MSCWCLPKPVAYVCLGKYGDLIQLLPAFLALYERTGEKPTILVSRPYADLFEGVSYINAWTVECDWSTGGPEARRQAEAAGFRVVFPAWWNDVPEYAPAEASSGPFTLHSHGHVWRVNRAVLPDYGTAMWRQLGFSPEDMTRLPLVFDRRDATREADLIKSVVRGKKPLLLYNFTGKASPFPAVPEVVNRLLGCGSRFQLVDLGTIRASRIYDLLGLYDIAAGLVTSDTSTLHLAPASHLEYIAFTQDGWLGSVPKGRCIANHKYVRAIFSGDEVAQMASEWGRDISPRSTLTIRRTAALGDVLAATAVARQAKAMGFHVVFQAYNLIHGMLKRSPYVDAVAEPQGSCDIDLDGAYEKHDARRRQSFTSIFIETANKHALSKLGAPMTTHNCAPSLMVSQQEREAILPLFQPHPRPWVVISPRSNNWANRTIPDGVWAGAAPKIKGTCFWTGMHAPAPSGLVDLQCRDIDYLIRCLSVADQFVGVDSGPMHMAAALHVPVLAIEQASSPSLHLTDQRDFEGVRVPGLTCLNCQLDLCPVGSPPPCTKIDGDWLAAEVNRKLAALQTTVSAIIPVYKPTPERLTKVLEHVLPQVDDVVITAEEGVFIPPLPMSPKVRVVVKNERKMGYGRNVNYGARHSCGKFMLLLNDDVFLEPDAVQKLLDEFKDADVGMAAHLLMYPNGTIFHAGKVRAPGARGWGHIDHRKYLPTITASCDMENVCGASVMVRRTAFYDIGGFDEDFFVYAEDDDFALRMRQHHWRIRYSPHARGTHLEHQSTQHLGSIPEVVNQANRLFHKKWHAYYDHNLNRVPGNFDYLKR